MLLHYHVDLRRFSFEERMILDEKLEKTAFICHPFLDSIGLYDVFWNSEEVPINQVLKIPNECIVIPSQKI